MNNTDYNFIFFGSDEFSVIILDALLEAGYIPKHVITPPDRPQGRGMQLTPPTLKTYARDKNISVLQPSTLSEIKTHIKETNTAYDFFVVASYGLIIDKEILEMPKHGTLNVHPSLLPLYRGATPIESAMLDDAKETGVTIMLMDEKMDHGPIIAQEVVVFDVWPEKKLVHDTLATVGSTLLAQSIEPFIAEEIIPQKQPHGHATYTKKITKADGEITERDTDREKYLKYLAYQPWPGVYYFDAQDKRVKISKARFEDGTFIIERIVPEGRKEQDYSTS